MCVALGYLIGGQHLFLLNFPAVAKALSPCYKNARVLGRGRTLFLEGYGEREGLMRRKCL